METDTVRLLLAWTPRGDGVRGILTVPATASVLMVMTGARSSSMSELADSAEELSVWKLRDPTNQTDKKVVRKTTGMRALGPSLLGLFKLGGVCVCVCVCDHVLLF